MFSSPMLNCVQYRRTPMPRFPSSAVLTTLSILEFLGASRELGAIGLARHVPQPSDGSRRSRERVGRRHPQNEDSSPSPNPKSGLR
jgi:hypothetical protein